VKDWPRHKKPCTGFRPFKAHAAKLKFQQKQALNEITSKVPPLEIEYRKKYPGDTVHHLFIASGRMMTEEMMATNLGMLVKADENCGDFAKRWQDISPELDEFIKHAKPGDVFEKKRYRVYHPPAPQHFRNTPIAEPTVLANGTTVVDIGFVDFGITFDSIDSIDLEGKPVTVLGYDMQPFCVAKSMVMIAMIKDREVGARSVIEVWLSSLWSKVTFRAFKRATGSILGQGGIVINGRVRDILEHWNSAKKMLSKAAIQFQFQAEMESRETRFAMTACSLEKEEDRVGYLRYYLTKAFYEDETTTIGSIVMNFEKEDIGIKQIFESCYESAPAHIHHHGNSCSPTVIGRTRSYFEKNMEKFIYHVRNGTLIFIPKLGTVSENNHAMIQEVKRAKPYIVSWSNVVDYIHPQKFHKIAKSMSCEGTAHYLHTCNWTSRVYGTDVYDMHEEGRLHFFSAGLTTMKNGGCLVNGFSSPVYSHFRDVCATVLAREYVNKFFQYFFRGQKVNCSCFNGNTPLKLPYALSRTGSTAFVIFAYEDAGLSFGQDTYDYTGS